MACSADSEQPPPHGGDGGTPVDDAGPRPDGPQTDGDGDTIGDYDEGGGGIDTDMDGMPDTADVDSDGDGFSDAQEAGDADVSTRPIDTDDDHVPDYRDLDSDGDGLPDASESMEGTDRLDPDTDGDGAPDLVEIVAGTSPTDPTTSPRARGDFYFVVPYEEDPMPPSDSLVFSTALRTADVYVAIDTSVSMQPYIDNFRASLSGMVFPGVVATLPDVQMGVAQFDACPSADFTRLSGECVGIRNEQSITADVPSVEAALARLTAECRPVNEPYAQTMWVFATGDTSRWPTMAPRACPAGTIGYACVRAGAVPILVVMGDEPFSESYNTSSPGCTSGECSSCTTFPTPDEIAAALNAIGGKVIVVGPTGRSADYGVIATMTGSVDAAGMPLVFPVADATTASMQVVDAIRTLAEESPIDVSARARDLDLDGVDATQFIERIDANTTGGIADVRDPTRVCVGGLPTADTNGDGFPDTFPDLDPGTSVCFDIIARRNTTVMPTDRPQVFRAAIDVMGDGITVLDTREVYFLVPPAEGTPIII